KREPWQDEAKGEDLPLANLFVSLVQRLGVETDSFADSTGIGVLLYALANRQTFGSRMRRLGVGQVLGTASF
ncbi:MAG: hypothetical protein VXZ15_06375, partial [Planctomycetota bacterium]|nr:hypothetical protein [Planctomycetota bacterium]